MNSSNNNAKDKKPRELCLISLVKYSKNRTYSNIELNTVLTRNNLSDIDRAFLTRLLYGVTEKIITLDYYISKVSDKNIKTLSLYVLNILRMGIYQLEYMDRVPDNAACNESVELAKKYDRNSSNFVNAILRNFIRNRDKIKKSIDYLDDISRLEVKYSCPAELINLWSGQYGFDIAKRLAEKSSEKSAMTITVNNLKISREEYIKHLNEMHLGQKGQISFECANISPRGITLLKDMPVKSLYGFDDGLFFVQDESSQICAMETEAKEGDLIIDCCAAPGGKSFYMAQMMNNKGRIISFDLHKNKLRLIEESAKRLAVDIIETREHNSIEVFSEYVKKADVVLCDTPCSGFGVMSKKPEIKYKPLDEMSRLPEVQLKILTASANYVKENGLLIYSTCTLNKRENEEVIKAFLDANKNFKCVDFVNILSSTPGIKTFFPFEGKIDGFFLAKMRKFGV